MMGKRRRESAPTHFPRSMRPDQSRSGEVSRPPRRLDARAGEVFSESREARSGELGRAAASASIAETDAAEGAAAAEEGASASSRGTTR